MRSSIFWPRSDFALCSPSAQRTASPQLLLPQPLGPTMPVMPGMILMTVLSPNDLKPWRVIASRRMRDFYTRVAESQRKNHQPWGPGAPSAPDVEGRTGRGYFLKRLPKDRLASSGRTAPPEVSRSTVTISENAVHSLRARLSATRSTIGCAHSKRRDGSKCAQCRQACSSARQCGHCASESAVIGSTPPHSAQREIGLLLRMPNVPEGGRGGSRGSGGRPPLAPPPR